jgi:hypothetical protein
VQVQASYSSLGYSGRSEAADGKSISSRQKPRLFQYISSLLNYLSSATSHSIFYHNRTKKGKFLVSLSSESCPQVPAMGYCFKYLFSIEKTALNLSCISGVLYLGFSVALVRRSHSKARNISAYKAKLLFSCMLLIKILTVTWSGT